MYFFALVKEGYVLLLYHIIIIVIMHNRNISYYLHIYALYESSLFPWTDSTKATTFLYIKILCESHSNEVWELLF